MSDSLLKLKKIEAIVNNWLAKDNHPECIDEINEIINPKPLIDNNPDQLTLDDIINEF